MAVSHGCCQNEIIIQLSHLHDLFIMMPLSNSCVHINVKFNIYKNMFKCI